MARTRMTVRLSIVGAVVSLLALRPSPSEARIERDSVGQQGLGASARTALPDLTLSSPKSETLVAAPATSPVEGLAPDPAANTPEEFKAPNQGFHSRRASALKAESPTRKRNAARLNDMSAERFESALSDDTAEIDTNDRLLYVDTPLGTGPEATAPIPAEWTPTATPDTTGTEPQFITFTDAFALHSKPGSTKTLYLDFDGATTVGTYWNQRVGIPSRTSPAYDSDGNPAQFSAAELTNIQAIWDATSEDFMPFDVDVTTAQPSFAQLNRSSALDNTYGSTVVVTGDNWQCPTTCSGVSYVNSFGATDDAAKPSWAFVSPSYATFVDAIAGIISHEAGHAFGLSHDGSSVSSYYAGHGIWQPIMGSGPYSQRPLSQWSKGEYIGANNFEDDISIIARTSPVIPDDVPGVSILAPGQQNYSVPGIIEREADVDTYRVEVGSSGRLNVLISPVANARNLDVRLEIRNAQGILVKQQSSVSVGYISAVGPYPAGIYDVSVIGAGYGNPFDTGYSTYGSLGRYRLSISLFTQPSPPLNIVSVAGDRSITATWDPPADDGGGISEYWVALCPSAGICSNLVATLRTATFPNLPVGSVYSINVRAKNSFAIGQTGFGSFITVVGVPSAPAITPLVSGQIVNGFSWLPGATNGSSILGYELSIIDLLTNAESLITFPSTSSTGTFGSGNPLGPLPLNTSTLVKIRTTSSVGKSEWSAGQIVNYGRWAAGQGGSSSGPRQAATGSSPSVNPRP
jgi:hypothetical protein